MASSKPTRSVLFISLALILTTLAVFNGVQRNAFVSYDDPDYLTQNPAIQRGLSINSLKWAFTTNHASNWHPLTWMSHIIDWQLFGPSAGKHHLMNVLLHAVSGALLFSFLNRTTGALWRSAFVAALFALHPLRTESVAWAAERKDTLSMFFGLLTLLLYSRYASKPTLSRFTATLLCFALALLSKPMLITLPAVMLLLDFWPLRRLRPGNERAPNKNANSKSGDAGFVNGKGAIRKLIVEKIPYAILAAVAAILTLWAQHSGGSVRTISTYPLSERISNALVSYVRYIAKIFVPRKLSVFYPTEPWPLVFVVAAAVLLASITFLIVRSNRRFPFLFCGWLWFVITLIPVIGIIQVGNQSMADRYTYLPTIGLFIMMTWGAAEALGRSRHRYILPIAATMALASCALLTIQQVKVWKATETLFRHALAVTKNNWTAHENLAIDLGLQAKVVQREGRTDEARTKQEEAAVHFHAALEIQPDAAELHHNFGTFLLGQHDFAGAELEFQEAIRLKPDYGAAYLNLGTIAVEQKDAQRATDFFEKAVEYQPDDPTTQFNLATGLLQTGNLDGAAMHYTKALQLRPDDIGTLFQLAQVALRQNNREQSIGYLRQILALDPNHNGARLRLSQLESR